MLKFSSRNKLIRDMVMGSMVALFGLGNSFSLKAAETVKVEVRGMVCTFCVQRVKKSLEVNDAVNMVNVNMDQKTAYVTLKDGQQLTDDEIKKVVKDAGYDVNRIVRVKPKIHKKKKKKTSAR